MATQQVTGSISGLAQGVSEQTPLDRLPDQCEAQINCTADVAKGLMTRPTSAVLSAYTQVADDQGINDEITCTDNATEATKLVIGNGTDVSHGIPGPAIGKYLIIDGIIGQAINQDFRLPGAQTNRAHDFDGTMVTRNDDFTAAWNVEVFDELVGTTGFGITLREPTAEGFRMLISAQVTNTALAGGLIPGAGSVTGFSFQPATDTVLYKTDAGTSTTINTATGHTPQEGDSYWFRWHNGTIQVSINGGAFLGLHTAQALDDMYWGVALYDPGLAVDFMTNKVTCGFAENLEVKTYQAGWSLYNETDPIGYVNSYTLPFTHNGAARTLQVTKSSSSLPGGMLMHDHLGQTKTILPTAGAESYLKVPPGYTSARAFFAYAWQGHIALVNRFIKPTMLPDVYPDRRDRMIVWIKQANFGITYEMFYQGSSLGTYTEPTPAVLDSRVRPDPLAFQDAFANWLTSKGADFQRSKGIFVINAANLEHISVNDPNNGNDIATIHDAVVSRAQLPPRCVAGYKVKHIGKDNNPDNDYWLEFQPFPNSEAIGGMQDGEWVECAEPGTVHTIDKTTMPHIFTEQSDGSWTFGPMDWQPRKAGNDNNNPLPSCIGENLTSCGIFQGRFWMTAGSNLVMSKAGQKDQLFADSVRMSLTTDPVDVMATGQDTVKLLFGGQVANSLVLTSKDSQYIIDGSKPVTPMNINMSVSTNLACHPDVQPTIAADRMFLYSTNSNFPGFPGYGQLSELRIDKQRGTPFTQVLSKHIPTYLPPDGRILKCDPKSERVFLLTGGGRDLYVYEYYIGDDGKRQQSAWGQWKFKDSAVAMSVLEDGLNIMFTSSDRQEYRYELIPMIEGMFGDVGEIALDHKDFSMAIVEGDEVFVDTKVRVSEDNMPTCITTSGALPIGKVMKLEYVNNTRLKLTTVKPEQAANLGVCVGWPFEARYTITPPYHTDNRGNKYEPYRLVYKDMQFTYKDSGTIFVEIEHKSRTEPIIYEFSPMRVGQSRYGQQSSRSGKDRFAVRGQHDRTTISFVHKDTHLPMQLTGIQWRGTLTSKGRFV